MTKERVNVWISHENRKMLEQWSKAPGTTQAAIVDAALSAYFFPERDENAMVKLLDRVDQLDYHQAKIEKDVRICVETLGHFVLYYLSMMRPLPDEERIAAQKAGRRRYEFFVDQVGEKVSGDDGLANAILKSLGLEEPPEDTANKESLIAAE